MAHWENRPEANWKKFKFNQPYEKGLKRLKEEVLAKTDFDPATLWQWGTMQAMAVIRILKDVEAAFGAKGQEVVGESIRKIGLDIGRQIVKGFTRPEGVSDEELLSFYATVINRIAYASLEDPKIDGEGKVSFHIVWCPHQDHYKAFDCRVQRYFVQGMMDAMRELGEDQGWQVKFTQTIPAGAETCHFEIWKATQQEKAEWAMYTEALEKRALEVAEEKKRLSQGAS